MSEIKVNKISPRAACGTVQLGDSGDTFTIPAGATINNQGTATNFGATGSASWTTTVKTGDFTAVAGEGYFVDTSSGEIDVALPAGTAGAVVAIADYANNFNTNNVILVQNGSDKIAGSTSNAILSTDGLAVTLIFIDSTKGWIVTDDGNQSVADTNPFIEATGGTVTNTPTCRIHTFTGPGTFSVSALASSPANNQVSYVVVAGGGGGGRGNSNGAGGGAGGYRETKSPVTPYTASPLDGQPNSPNRITVTATDFPITVGAGAATTSSTGAGSDGSNSSFSTITATGGGGGGNYNVTNGRPGGSGGGAGGPNGCSGNGNTPSQTPPQGNSGGATPTGSGHAGGGGAGASGTNGPPSPGGPAGAGGAGTTSEITGSPVTRAGGGGGGYDSGSYTGGAGGSGGGGGGSNNNAPGTAGTANTGGGGGGNGPINGLGGAGGSGIVIIRYKNG